MKYPRGIIPRGRKLSINVFEPASGKWKLKATGIDKDSPGAIPKAVAYRDAIEAQLLAGAELSTGLTFSKYVARWLEHRTNWNKGNEQQILRDHVEPFFGRMQLTEIRPHHIKAWVRGLAGKGLAPKTVHNVYGVAHVIFANAAADELITTSPCHKRHDGLPKKRDKDPEWRECAIFTVAEVERLLTDKRLPLRDRAANAVRFLGGLRSSELAALRWGDYNADIQPLGRLSVRKAYATKARVLKETKEDTPRQVPVHAAAAQLLTEWRYGWAYEFGHQPAATDVMFPPLAGPRKGTGHWTNTKQWASFDYWLDKLELPHRRVHDTRRTFVSVYLDAGAKEHAVKWIKDGRPKSGDSIDGYKQPAWPALCAEVAKLQIRLDCNAKECVLPQPIANPAHSDEATLQYAQKTPVKHDENPQNTTLHVSDLPDFVGEIVEISARSHATCPGSSPAPGTIKAQELRDDKVPYTYIAMPIAMSGETARRTGEVAPLGLAPTPPPPPPTGWRQAPLDRALARPTRPDDLEGMLGELRAELEGE